jgi:hypothetical protein
MEAAGRTAEKGIAPEPPSLPETQTAVNALSVLSLQSWSDHALSTLNSAAALTGILAGAVLLVSLAILYFSGHEMSARASARPGTADSTRPATPARPDQTNGSAVVESPAEVRKVARLTKQLAEAKLLAESKRADLVKATAELDRIQKSEKAKTERVTKLEGDVATIRRAEEEKSSRVAQLEGELSELRQTGGENANRLAELQKDLVAARKTSEQQAFVSHTARTPEVGRTLSDEQRSTFLKAVNGLPTGRVMISAFFENKETHDFGRAILAVLKDAGFTVVEQAPVNFFTTSRPSSGIRIGCENMAHPPAHFTTLRKGFEAMGIEISDASVVNADAADIVEIQITPKD